MCLTLFLGHTSTPPQRAKKEHFLCILACVCVHGGFGAKFRETPHTPCTPCNPRGETMTHNCTHTYTCTYKHTILSQHSLCQSWPWPDLPTGSPTERHWGLWEKWNRKWALSKLSVKAMFIMSWSVCGKVCRTRLEPFLIVNNASGCNG